VQVAGYATLLLAASISTHGQLAIQSFIRLTPTNQIEISWPTIPNSADAIKRGNDVNQPWASASVQPDLFVSTGNSTKALLPIEAGKLFFQVVTCCAPSVQGTWPGFTRGNAYGLDLSGNYAYIAGSASGLHIVDVHDPTNPVRTSGYKFPSAVWSVHVVSNFVYVATDSSGLQILDITDRQIPIVRQESSIDIGDFTGEPLPVRNRNHLVVFAVHDQNGDANLTQFALELGFPVANSWVNLGRDEHNLRSR
jgi:hypothetical protein